MPWQAKRDRILFTVGLAGLGVEFALWAIIRRPPDLTFTSAFVGFAIGPAVLRRDEEQSS